MLLLIHPEFAAHGWNTDEELHKLRAYYSSIQWAIEARLVNKERVAIVPSYPPIEDPIKNCLDSFCKYLTTVGSRCHPFSAEPYEGLTTDVKPGEMVEVGGGYLTRCLQRTLHTIANTQSAIIHANRIKFRLIPELVYHTWEIGLGVFRTERLSKCDIIRGALDNTTMPPLITERVFDIPFVSEVIKPLVKPLVTMARKPYPLPVPIARQ